MGRPAAPWIKVCGRWIEISLRSELLISSSRYFVMKKEWYFQSASKVWVGLIYFNPLGLSRRRDIFDRPTFCQETLQPEFSLYFDKFSRPEADEEGGLLRSGSRISKRRGRSGFWGSPPRNFWPIYRTFYWIWRKKGCACAPPLWISACYRHLKEHELQSGGMYTLFLV